jgi:tetratricopeptide (TPR) repeat protein
MEAIQTAFFMARLLLVLAWSSLTSLRYYLGEMIMLAASVLLAILAGGGQWQLHHQELSSLQVGYLNKPSFPHFYELVKKIHQLDTVSAQELVKREEGQWNLAEQDQLAKVLDQREFLEQETSFWQQVLRQQPTHRDVLWNLYLLEKAQGNTSKATDYERQAQRVDPNFPFAK